MSSLLALRNRASMSIPCGQALAAGGYGHDSGAKGDLQSPAAALKAVIEGNERFTAHHDHNYFEAYQKGQIPAVTVISCSDSRVHTPLFGMDPHNNVFIIHQLYSFRAFAGKKQSGSTNNYNNRL